MKESCWIKDAINEVHILGKDVWNNQNPQGVNACNGKQEIWKRKTKSIVKCTEGVYNFTGKKTKKINRCLKKCLISIVIRKMLIRTIMRWHLTLNSVWDIRKGKQQAFKNLFIYFNWRIITLQYCDGFAMLQYELAIGIHVSSPSWTLLPPPSPPYPCRL